MHETPPWPGETPAPPDPIPAAPPMAPLDGPPAGSPAAAPVRRPVIHPARRARLVVGAASAGALVVIAGVLANQTTAGSSPARTSAGDDTTQTVPGDGDRGSDGQANPFTDDDSGDDGFTAGNRLGPGGLAPPAAGFGQPGSPSGQPTTNSHGS